MISTLKKLQAKRAAQENNGGFTLIELLIVIVVLGILAAVVVFSLGGVAGTSAVAACKADGASIDTALAAYAASNAGGFPTSTTQLVGANAYLATWPSNTSHYIFALASTGGLVYVAPTGTPAVASDADYTKTGTVWQPVTAATVAASCAAVAK